MVGNFKLPGWLLQVGNFKLHAVYVGFKIDAAPDPASLPDLNARWKTLKNKTVASKFPDGWKVGKVWKKGTAR